MQVEPSTSSCQVILTFSQYHTQPTQLQSSETSACFHTRPFHPRSLPRWKRILCHGSFNARASSTRYQRLAAPVNPNRPSDHGHTEAPRTYRSNAEILWNPCQQAPSPPLPRRWLEHGGNNQFGRRLFQTTTGHIGLGPDRYARRRRRGSTVRLHPTGDNSKDGRRELVHWRRSAKHYDAIEASNA